MAIKGSSVQTLLSLKNNVMFVALKDPATGAVMSKMIHVNDRKTFTPTNNVAAALLYLLARDDKDPIGYNDFVNLVLSKYNGSTVGAIDIFLDKLDDDYKILQINTGKSGSKDLDPLKLFDPPPETWDTPDLTPNVLGKEPICKVNTFFSQNPIKVIYPR